MPRKSKNKQTFDKKVKNIVREQLSEEVEEKYAIIQYSDTPINAAIPSGVVFNNQGNFFQLMPPIVQSATGAAGKGYNTRIGNEISLKSLEVNGALSYNYSLTTQTNYQNSKLALRVMILRAKNINDVGVLFDNMPTTDLLRFGDSSSIIVGPVAFTGAPLDSFSDINRDTFSVKYDKVHYLNSPVISPGTSSVDLSLIPSSSKIFKHKINFGKNGLRLKFDDINDSVANNFPYFMVMGYSSMAGLGTPANGLARVAINCVSTYTDA